MIWSKDVCSPGIFDGRACIYAIENKRNGKFYIGKTGNCKVRLGAHFYQLKNGRNTIKEMQEDFNNGDEFEVHIFCPFDTRDLQRQERALETLYILQYNSVKDGYNKSYNFPSIDRAYEIIEENAEYIVKCLKNQRIRFRIEIIP